MCANLWMKYVMRLPVLHYILSSVTKYGFFYIDAYCLSKFCVLTLQLQILCGCVSDLRNKNSTERLNTCQKEFLENNMSLDYLCYVFNCSWTHSARLRLRDEDQKLHSFNVHKNVQKLQGWWTTGWAESGAGWAESRASRNLLGKAHWPEVESRGKKLDTLDKNQVW